MLRVVVDTSVWVSALLNPVGSPARILAALLAGRFWLVISEPLVAELAGVLARPRLLNRYHLTPANVARLLDAVSAGELTALTGSLHVCRDPNDDMVIETAINGHADVLVSRDDDLKRSPEVAAMLAEHGVSVLTVQQFLTQLEAERPTPRS